MEKIDRATFRELFKSALKTVDIDEVADLSNRKLDNVIAAVGDALATALTKKKKVAVLMHTDEGKIGEMFGLELSWRKPKKGFRKGEKYERRPSPLAPIQEWEEEVEYDDGTVMIEGRRQESKAASPSSWGIKARARGRLLAQLPAAPQRKPR